jgi:hypothetical protein
MAVSRAEFARMAGVSKPAITQGVRRGIIVPTTDGNIDPEHPTNSLYLDTRAANNAPQYNPGVKKPPKPTPKAKTEKPARIRKAPTPDPEIDLPDPDTVDIDDSTLDEIDFDHPERIVNRYPDLVSRDKAAATLKRLVEIRRHEQARRKEAGVLIERDFVVQRFATFAEVVRQQLLTTPRRIAAQVVARARAEDERAVEEYLASEISAAIGRALQELEIE